jgi:hypothetical protein
MHKKIEKICNQEIEVMTANETKHETHYIFLPTWNWGGLFL